MKLSKRVIVVCTLFLVLVAFLYFSYIRKLGFLNYVSYLFFVICPALIILNMFFVRKDRQALLYWMMLLVAFTYAMLDKVLRIHVAAAGMVTFYTLIPPKAIIDIIYVTGFIILNAFFYRYLLKEIDKSGDWVFLLITAILVKITGTIVDIITNHSRIEDYFELFSLYFFISSFLVKLQDDFNPADLQNIIR